MFCVWIRPLWFSALLVMIIVCFQLKIRLSNYLKVIKYAYFVYIAIII